MSAVVLPDPVAPVPSLRASPEALEVTRSTRLAATLVADVHAVVLSRGAPAGASGRAATAASDELRAFAASAGTALAALEVATRALEVFVDDVAALTRRRTRTVEAGAQLDADVADLRSRIALAVAEDPGWRAEAAALHLRHARLLDDVRLLLVDEREAEDAVVAGLGSVDTVAEGERVAADPSRPTAAFVVGLRERLRALLGRPDAVQAWWAGLRPDEREALIVDDPDLVVNAGGVPAEDRDDAGRTALARDLPLAEGRRRDLLDALRAALERDDEARLLFYDPDGDGRAALGYGDPDTADHTAVLVPGLGTDLTSVDSLGSRALDVRDQALAQGADGSVAVVVWVGYDAPDLHLDGVGDLLGTVGDGSGVLHEGRAEAGAGELGTFVAGLRGSDEGDPSRLSVVGHSYGSTTVGLAAADGLDADAVVLLGSPGAGGGADHADELSDDGRREVYAGSRDHDPVTWLGGDGDVGLGRDPSQESFGATRIDVGEGRAFHTDQLGTVGLEDNHATYFEPGSDSLDNVVRIIEGEQPTTVPGRDEPARDLIGDWVADEARHQAEQLGDLLTGWLP